MSSTSSTYVILGRVVVCQRLLSFFFLQHAYLLHRFRRFLPSDQCSRTSRGRRKFAFTLFTTYPSLCDSRSITPGCFRSMTLVVCGRPGVWLLAGKREREREKDRSPMIRWMPCMSCNFVITIIRPVPSPSLVHPPRFLPHPFASVRTDGDRKTHDTCAPVVVGSLPREHYAAEGFAHRERKREREGRKGKVLFCLCV